MKRNLALLGATLALGIVGIVVLFSSRSTGANANAAAPSDSGTAKAAKDEGPKIATSKISHVTIYPDSALVTREVDVAAGNGLQELVINPMPEATITSSLYSESTEGIRVLTTRFRMRPVKEDTREEVRKLEEEIRKIQMDGRKIQADIKHIGDQNTYASKLENFTTASTTHAAEKGKLESDNVIALSKYLMEGRSERSKQLVALNEQLLLNTEALDYANRKLRSITTTTSKIERDAVIVIDKVNAAVGKVKLNYLVSSASWKPQYKFRAGKTSKDPVIIEYLAAVMQQTGEDWERVNITLSTAQPMLNAAPPDLHALAVNVVPRGNPMPGVSLSGLQGNAQLGGGPGAGGFRTNDMAAPLVGRVALTNPAGASPEEVTKAIEVLRRQAQVFDNQKRGKDASEVANYAANLDQARDLVMEQVKGRAGEGTGRPSKNEGPSVTYHLGTKLSVPSRHDDQVIEVTKLELKPDYYYKAVPVLTPHVYRQATLTNKSEFVLLPGESTMYNGTDFVGRMALPLVAIGEEFTVGFGAEPQLQVVRQMMDKQKTIQGGNQILKFDYRILVSSYKTEKVKVQVWDRLPFAENEAMGVSLLKATPEVCKDPLYLREERANNLLRWDLEVTPEMKGEKATKISYEFKLDLDKQATLGSFATK